MKDSVRYWSVPGNKTRWRTSSKYVDIQSRFRKCARSFDFCDESSLVIQCWTWSAWTCVFVFYLLVGSRQTMIRDWYGAFLRILKLSTFFLEKVYSHWKWFPLYCLSVERHCFRKLRLKRRKYICKVLLIRRQQTISSRAPLCKIVLGQSAHLKYSRDLGKPSTKELHHIDADGHWGNFELRLRRALFFRNTIWETLCEQIRNIENSPGSPTKALIYIERLRLKEHLA